MLAKPERLCQTKEIEQVFRRGQSRRGQFFYLKFLLPKEKTKANIIISAKVSKKSVIRHRLKRQANAVLAKYIGKMPKGYYSLVVQNLAVGRTFAELKMDLEQLLGQIKPRPTVWPR